MSLSNLKQQTVKINTLKLKSVEYQALQLKKVSVGYAKNIWIAEGLDPAKPKFGIDVVLNPTQLKFKDGSSVLPLSLIGKNGIDEETENKQAEKVYQAMEAVAKLSLEGFESLDQLGENTNLKFAADVTRKGEVNPLRGTLVLRLKKTPGIGITDSNPWGGSEIPVVDHEGKILPFTRITDIGVGNIVNINCSLYCYENAGKLGITGTWHGIQVLRFGKKMGQGEKFGPENVIEEEVEGEALPF